MSLDVLVQTTIARPVEDVATYASDPENAPIWYANIKSIRWRTGPPLALDAEMDFVARFQGRKLVYTYRVSELIPGKRLVMETIHGPFPMRTTYTWEPVGDGTLMTLRNSGTPKGFSKIATPLMSAAVRRANKRDLAKLKAILERSA